MRAAARLRVYFIEIWARGGSTTTAGGDRRARKTFERGMEDCTVRASPPDLSGLEGGVGSGTMQCLGRLRVSRQARRLT